MLFAWATIAEEMKARFSFSKIFYDKLYFMDLVDNQLYDWIFSHAQKSTIGPTDKVVHRNERWN